ncbi:hypothetical protein GQX73_g4245 [Xylaria multiplex]|uniref:ubiquitinyl hydrolase 1 n=1 Tax=Xylaria multiplex TaxID=323545 RepID=A0A7C8IUC4_9PEZI|nr:hypothetical protein GQX73_g4245 [Xylaria multiplex]
MATNSDTLLYIFNHLFLPSKLPQYDDYNASREKSLLSTTIEGLIAWRDCTEPSRRGQADAAISTMRNMQQAYSTVDGYLNETEVLGLLTHLTEDTAIPLYIREQNAGVLISRHSHRVFFEVFEVSPSNQVTMTTRGRLRRSFPGASVVLEESDFQQPQFQEAIAHTLADMSRHPVEAMQPKVEKAKNTMIEDRDTNHPGMISELLIGFLKSIGKAVECPIIAKNMRDDVLWDDSKLPWRRSPSWLVVRVALQLNFSRKPTPMTPDTLYKEAILFILSYTLTVATQQSLSSEALYSMSAKIARRLLKIGPAVDVRVLRHVQDAMKSAHAKLSERWSIVQKQDAPAIDVTKFSDLDFITDCYVPILELDNHIKWMGVRRQEQILGNFEPPSTLMVFLPHVLPRLPPTFANESESDAIANLKAFETWVALYCREWIKNDRYTPCEELSSLIATYHNLALPYYSKNPEALSSMLLTIFELWVACDDAAVKLCSLLGEYDPGIPYDVLQNLLLPFKSQMQRLHRVEQYLLDRSFSARFKPTSLYYYLDNSECFPKYDDLMTLSNRLECEDEYVLVDQVYELKHKASCKKCKYANEAANLEIRIHEWPLPRDNMKAKSVVFELCIPSFFQSWRQATFYVLWDVVGMRYSKESTPSSQYTLADDPHLRRNQSYSSRIGLLSGTKPQVATHRREQSVSTATDTSVCVNNGLNYRYFDSKVNQFVEPFRPTTKVLEMCTYHLPLKSRDLQNFLFRPATSPNGPGSNVAIADQSEAPIHMSVEEARDLAMLPLGHRIQFHNVLVQLAAPSLDFRKDETAIFVLQCLYQSGPSGDTPLRASHAIIDDERFAFSLLRSLMTAWDRVKENWESAQALIASNSLALYVRGGFAWVELLRDKSYKAANPDDGIYLKLKSADVALICASCFDVEEHNLSKILESDNDASIFVQCSILIQEGKRTYDPASELTLACLSLRFRRLLYRSFPILSKTHSGISDAVRKSWSAYRPGGEWRVARNTKHWLVTETTPDNNGAQFQVHYNLLSGELLVNGIPLSRPPREYEDHPMWCVLFDQIAVEVMPTSAPAMQFSAKRQYKGYDVRFGRKENSSGSSDLLVQASCSNIDYETIPSRLLRGMFPDHFINDFVHWYNHTNDTVEFRPLATPWNSRESMWVLSRSPQGWTLKRKGSTSTVLGTKSRTVTAIADILSPLADKPHIHVMFQPSSKTLLEVEMPALRLGFFLGPGESSLRSREFIGMSIDDDQSLGALSGFANKLLLKSERCRLVLVPEGPVSWASANGHIRVTVCKASITKVHPLYIDSVLGRLTDNGNLQCKLFLSYLHALTSYCLPDPLTKRTGVEQALSILNSAAVRSFDRLSQQNIDILTLIARLSPTRQYYPQNEKVMQTVSWVPDLSFLSHHGGFYQAVGAIFEQASQTSLFYSGLDSEKLNICDHIDTNEFLMHRDRIRTSTFQISGFGAEEHTTAYDVTYCGRHCDQGSVRGINALMLSSMLYEDRTTLLTAVPQVDELWKIMRTVQEVLDPNQDLHVSQLGYSAGAANSGLDLSQWLMLHKVLSTESAMANKFNLMIWLSAMAAHEQADMRLLQVLVLFTTLELRGVEFELTRLCHPPKGYKANSEYLKRIIDSYLVGIDFSPEAQLREYRGESTSSYHRRRNKQYSSNQSRAISTLVNHLLGLWQIRALPTLEDVDQEVSAYVRLTQFKPIIRKQFQEWFANLRLFEYLQRLETDLSHLSECSPTLDQPKPIALAPPARGRAFVSTWDLFAGAAPALPVASSAFEMESSSTCYAERTSRLLGLLDSLEKTASKSQYEASYIEELRDSMRSLQEHKSAVHPNLRERYPVSILLEHLESCKMEMDELHLLLETEGSAAHRGILEVGHGPRISQTLFLQNLSNQAWRYLSLGWRKCIVRYGLALSALQRAERLVRAAISQSDEELIKELGNIGHRTWDPLEHPEWLLLEVESNIIIRDVQGQIASEMISPRSHCNAVLQLNMGEGKSSVIVPMIAAELADGSQLARVIVAKPQSKQMAQMLISKLGGLLNRRVYHMPFSRSLKATTAIAEVIDQMMRECQDSGGVLLVQPEHLLSFQLMGIECYFNGHENGTGELFIRLQDFFNNNSRDIVDESDENFSPKFELVYTMGSQRPIELSPARWICLHQVLSLVRSLATGVADEFPQSIDINPGDDGGFPRLRILKADAGELLIERVAKRICDVGIDGFPIARQQEHVREAVFKYITQRHLGPAEISAVEEVGDGGFWTESTKPLLLLLRGILAGGVLEFALRQKRWRVNFGLAMARTPPTRLAVPYRAKDNPAPRSEFSHPDVVILLTSLSYYYGGLEDEDLFISLGHLMESDQANIEYNAWLNDSPSMPAAFCQLEGINLKDRPQCISDVFPHLKYGKSVIDYFLGHIVFPKEVKEFPFKLSASGWDIGKRKANYTTGFSGTKDSCKLLPLDINPLDLPSQKHTNALVLEYLLQPENSVILLPGRPMPSITNAEYFLDTVVKFERPTRVILDVGAQILELNNQEVAQRWLQKVTEVGIQAAVFINDDDDLTVVDRGGNLELLQTSSYATRLHACLVFLDEAHTRGIDLKLPSDYRAAVTLGANLTKDRLVQACMRLRKLGRGQSVVFCVDGEISAKIRSLTAKSTGAAIGVKDVLHWAIAETFAEIGRNMPLWVAQGDRFLRQEELWRSTQDDGVTRMSNMKAELFVENDAPSIEARYRPRLEEATSITSLLPTESQRFQEIKKRCSEFEHLNFNLSVLEEEQERELSPEVERERQVQRPDPAPPAKHSLHPHIVEFTATGRLTPNSPAYMGAFHSLHDTSAAEYFKASQLSNDKFLVTKDFAETVNASSIGYTSDSFQRPVQWILSSCTQGSNVVDVLMLISPHEAEELIPWPQSKRSDKVTLHLYKPRCHTGHQPFDRLDFFTIPSRQPQLEVPRALLVQLNIFAGQLYFGEYEDYLDTCKFLGLAADVPGKGEIVEPDGYIVRDGNGESKFDRSPVKFLQALTSKVRRNGQSISKTHVGSMLEGKLLQRSEIEQ